MICTDSKVIRMNDSNLLQLVTVWYYMHCLQCAIVKRSTSGPQGRSKCAPQSSTNFWRQGAPHIFLQRQGFWLYMYVGAQASLLFFLKYFAAPLKMPRSTPGWHFWFRNLLCSLRRGYFTFVKNGLFIYKKVDDTHVFLSLLFWIINEHSVKLRAKKKKKKKKLARF